MPILVLDLDETVFVAKSRHGHIHPNHSKSPDIVGATAGSLKFTVNIINPAKLSELINTACISYDGVLILTSGAWDPSIRDLLVPYLHLSPEAARQFKSCRFHSSSTDSKLFNIDGSTLYHMDKYTRLKMIVTHYSDLKKLKLVLLDDNPKHKDAVLQAPDNTMIGAVLAATNQPEQDFYQKTLDVLAKAKQQENRLKDAECFHAPFDQGNRFFRYRSSSEATLITVAPRAAEDKKSWCVIL